MRKVILGMGALALCTGSAMAQEAGRFTATIGGTTSTTLGQRPVLGFSDDAFASLGYRYQGTRLGYNLEVSGESDGDGARLDRSYIETYWGEFAFGLGAIDRNWGPSRLTSLIMSSNARPFVSAYVQKRDYSSFDTPFLSWIGPWKGEIFFGQSDSPGNPDNTKLMGMRLQLQPLDGFEIDLVRTAQWGGRGRPEGFSDFIDTLVGRSNSADEPDANQLAGLGLSYTLPENIAPIRIYGQAIGEDESGGLPSCFMYLAGVEGRGQSFGVPTTVTVEGATTEIADSTNGFCGDGTAYTNFFYDGGYTNEGVVMGAPMDTDSRMVQLAVTHELSSFDLNWSLGYYVINAPSLPGHRLTAERTEGGIVRVGASRDFADVSVLGEVTYQSFDLERAGHDRGFGVGLRLAKSF